MESRILIDSLQQNVNLKYCPLTSQKEEKMCKALKTKGTLVWLKDPKLLFNDEMDCLGIIEENSLLDLINNPDRLVWCSFRWGRAVIQASKLIFLFTLPRLERKLRLAEIFRKYYNEIRRRIGRAELIKRELSSFELPEEFLMG